jgi:methionine--tRNA ligase beta chain
MILMVLITLLLMNKPDQEESCVTLEEFSKVRLRMGKIIHAENIPGMKKVVKVKVDIGSDQRDIAVGVAPHYKAEELVGRVVVVCANLCPRKIGNVISNGMLLAADGPGGKPIFLTTLEDCTIGASIR